MSHMKLSGYVRRGDNYRIGLLLGVYFCVEVLLFLPFVIKPVLKILRRIGLCEFFLHFIFILSLITQLFSRLYPCEKLFIGVYKHCVIVCEYHHTRLCAVGLLHKSYPCVVNRHFCAVLRL